MPRDCYITFTHAVPVIDMPTALHRAERRLLWPSAYSQLTHLTVGHPCSAGAAVHKESGTWAGPVGQSMRKHRVLPAHLHQVTRLDTQLVPRKRTLGESVGSPQKEAVGRGWEGLAWSREKEKHRNNVNGGSSCWAVVSGPQNRHSLRTALGWAVVLTKEHPVAGRGRQTRRTWRPCSWSFPLLL